MQTKKIKQHCWTDGDEDLEIPHTFHGGTTSEDRKLQLYYEEPSTIATPRGITAETPEVRQIDYRNADRGVDASFPIKTSTVMCPGLVAGKCEVIYDLLNRMVEKNAAAFYGNLKRDWGVVNIPTY